jgi:hypothetical protein
VAAIDAARVATKVSGMFTNATAWHAIYPNTQTSYFSVNDGPPHLWTTGAAPAGPAGPPGAPGPAGAPGALGAPGAPGAAVEDFPEWGVALVALSLALSTITSAVVVLRALCAPKVVYPAARV